MTRQALFAILGTLVVLVVMSGCARKAVSTPGPAKAARLTASASSTPSPIVKVAAPSNTPKPTGTAAPTKTPQPTRTPASTKTPQPTRTHAPAAPTKTPKPKSQAKSTPTAILPTLPPQAPGVDMLAAKGIETCVNKFVDTSFPWQGVYGGARQMWYWDKNWSDHPMYTSPYIKFNTVKALCEEKTCYMRPLKGPRGARGSAAYCQENMMCKGFSADFCVYIDPNSPSWEKTETTATVLVTSGTQAVYGELAEVKVKFSWQIK